MKLRLETAVAYGASGLRWMQEQLKHSIGASTATPWILIWQPRLQELGGCAGRRGYGSTLINPLEMINWNNQDPGASRG